MVMRHGSTLRRRTAHSNTVGPSMRLHAVFLLLICTHAASAQSTPERFLGMYSKAEKVCFAYTEGPICESTRNETIAISRKNHDLVYVGVNLVFYNGHGCAFYGVGRWRSGKIIASSPHPSSGKICRIEVSFNGRQASFREHSGDCSTPGFCSARGVLHGGDSFIRVP